MIRFRLNGEDVRYDGDERTPLMWALRETFDLTGTKFGCGIGQCGACMVHIDGRARPACVVPMGSIGGASVMTIEGLSAPDGDLHPVQKAWLEHDVPQCGYCQPGQIMATVDLLARIPEPGDADIDENLTNICRCGTYPRIRSAIHRAAELIKEGSDDAS